MISFEYILLAAAVLLILSILASKVSGRLGVPPLLLFLCVGMLAGSDGPGGIHFDDACAAQSLGVVALVFILFSGGLSTAWESVRPVLGKAAALSTLGVFVTAALVGVFAATVLGFSASRRSKGCCSGPSSPRPTRRPSSRCCARVASG